MNVKTTTIAAEREAAIAEARQAAADLVTATRKGASQPVVDLLRERSRAAEARVSQYA